MTEQPGIYEIRNLVNGKVYVGSASNISKRWSRHRKDLRAGQHPNQHLQAAWNRYGETSFRFGVLELTTNLTAREQAWMDQTGCVDPHRGYNKAPLARTTRGMTGQVRSPEYRAWLSRRMKGRAGCGVATEIMRGEANGAAKLTESDVVAIRARYGPPRGQRRPHGGLTYAKLAEEYGVSVSVICEVVRRTAWTHVEEVVPGV